jgi:lysozyme
MPYDWNQFKKFPDTSSMTKFFEGYKENIYEDSLGNPSIGYGFNLSDPLVKKFLPEDIRTGKRPLKKDDPIVEDLFMLRQQQAQRDARQYYGDGFENLPSKAQDTLFDMSYNMGLTRLNKFKGMREALHKGDYFRAAEELRYQNADTKTTHTPYFNQTGRRSRYHYETMTGLGA